MSEVVTCEAQAALVQKILSASSSVTQISQLCHVVRLMEAEAESNIGSDTSPLSKCWMEVAKTVIRLEAAQLMPMLEAAEIRLTAEQKHEIFQSILSSNSEYEMVSMEFGLAFEDEPVRHSIVERLHKAAPVSAGLARWIVRRKLLPTFAHSGCFDLVLEIISQLKPSDSDYVSAVKQLAAANLLLEAGEVVLSGLGTHTSLRTLESARAALRRFLKVHS